MVTIVEFEKWRPNVEVRIYRKILCEETTARVRFLIIICHSEIINFISRWMSFRCTFISSILNFGLKLHLPTDEIVSIVAANP